MSKHGKRGLLVLACCALSFLASISVYAACTSPTGDKGKIVYNAAENVMQYCNDMKWIAMGPLNAGASGTACSNPTRNEGAIVFNDAENVMQYCNGANWIAMGPVPGPGGSGCSNPTRSKGAMIFNDASKFMQYCNGTGWMAIGSSGIAAGSAPVYESSEEVVNIRQNMSGPTTYSEDANAPSGIETGDFLIAFVGMARVGTADPTGISGWTLLTSQTYGVRSSYVYYKIADASDEVASTYSLGTSVGGFSGYTLNMVVARYSNVDTADPFDVYSFSDQTFTSASSYDLPSVTTTGSNKLVGHYSYMSPRAAPTYLSYDSGTSPAGYNIREKSDDSTYDNSVLADKTQSTAGASGTATVNITPNGDGGGAAATVFSFGLNGPGGGGGGGGIDPDTGDVLETFDQDPFTGNPLFDDWGEYGGAPLGWEKSSSHVEQGSYSWHFSEIAPGALGGNAPAGYLDLSSYSSMTLQVHIDTIGANDQVGLYINDGTYSLNDKTLNGGTGDFVLEINFADQPLLNLSNINVTITTDTNEGDAKDFYIDNLRVQP